MRNHPEYHDVCQQVANLSFEEEKMDIDLDNNKKNTTSLANNSDGRFEQSALQQVIYVKRKTYQEDESKEERNQSAVTSVAHLLTTGLPDNDLAQRAV